MTSSTNKKPLEFTRKATEPKFNSSEPRREDFLFYLADGHSIEQACNLLGITRKGYENWRRRYNEDFPRLVEAARESHRRDIACGFHVADAYARSLLDAIQRDESLPAPLRYRASKTILTRKGKKDWLPDPIPADTEPLTPYDNEQSDYLTNDFTLNPERTTSEGAPATSNERSASESAEGATASCCHGQSEPASDAHAQAPSNLQAPKVAAELVPPRPPVQSSQIPNEPKQSPFSTPESGSQNPIHPFNPFTPAAPPFTPNLLQNQHNPVIPPIEASPQFSSGPFTSPASKPGEPTASAANSVPHPEPPAQQATLSQTWLSHTFLHKHENPRAFDKLLANYISTYQPASAPEELLVFRITQKAWLLRRVETWERVIADSRVAKVREKHPNAAAPACIAMALLEMKETNQTRFYERTAKLRKEHEDALDRLESKLFTSQQRREAKERRTTLQTPSVRMSEQALRVLAISTQFARAHDGRCR